MNRHLKYHVVEFIKAFLYLWLGSYIGALYNTQNALGNENEEFTIFEPKIPENPTFLTVLIVSAPKNSDARDILRETWLSACQPPRCIFKFAIGTDQISSKEIRDSTKKDMLHLRELKDSYHALTEKVAMSLEWISKNLQTDFVLKADEDTFADLPKLMHLLSGFGSDLYMGYFSGRARVKKSGPWAEPNWKICDYYLPNARGGGYVLGRDAIDFIGGNIKSLSIWTNEDVSVGGWLAPMSLNRVHMTSFDTEASSRGCSNSYIVTHKQSLEMIKEKWDLLQKGGEICKEEKKVKPGYEYNWNVPPSQCCIPDPNIP